MAISLDKKYVYFKETVTLPDAGDDKEFNVVGFGLSKDYSYNDPSFFVYSCDYSKFDKLRIDSNGIFITKDDTSMQIYEKNNGWFGDDDSRYTGLYFSGGNIDDAWLSAWVEVNFDFVEELKIGTEWEFNSQTLTSLTPWGGGIALMIGGYDHLKAGTLYNSNGDTLDIYLDRSENTIDLEYSGNVDWYSEDSPYYIYRNGSWGTVVYERFKISDDIPEGYVINPIFIQFLDKNATRISPQEPPTFMPHSITFFDYDGMSTVYRNTFDQWHIVPVERPIPSMPTVKKNYLEIPGADGVLDLSEFLTGFPLYENREGEFSFYILNGYDTFENIKTEISNYLHGKKKYMTLIDDPSYLYEGRFEVEFENDDSVNHSKCTISYNVKPYKVRFSHTVTSSGWTVEEIFPKERLL